MYELKEKLKIVDSNKLRGEVSSSYFPQSLLIPKDTN